MTTLAQVFAEADRKSHPNMAVIGPAAWAELHAWADKFAAKVGDSCGCGLFAQNAARALHDVVNLKLGKKALYPENLVEIAKIYQEAARMVRAGQEEGVSVEATEEGESTFAAERRSCDPEEVYQQAQEALRKAGDTYFQMYSLRERYSQISHIGMGVWGKYLPLPPQAKERLGVLSKEHSKFRSQYRRLMDRLAWDDDAKTYILKDCPSQTSSGVGTEQRLPLCTPAQQERLERCIQEVKTKGAKANPWAVCQASLECRRRRWQVPEDSGKWVYAPVLRKRLAALSGIEPWPEGMFDEEDEEEEDEEGMEKEVGLESPRDLGRIEYRPGLKRWDVIWYCGKRDVTIGHAATGEEAAETLQSAVRNRHKWHPCKATRLFQSFIDTILHTAVGTGVAIGVSKVLNLPAPSIIKEEEKAKDTMPTVAAPAHVEGDQANVDLGTLLEEIDAILKKPELMGIVDVDRLIIVRE